METKLIKDTDLREKILGQVYTNIKKLEAEYGKKPGIAFIGFMDVPLGKYNIPFHLKMASDLGFNVFDKTQPDDICENALFEVIDELNNHENIHAIVLLQPLPLHLVPVRIVNRITPEKEMEGFHPVNMIKTLLPDIADSAYPMCLPTALAELFRHNDIRPSKGDEWVLLLDDEFFSNQLVNMVTRTAFIKAVPSYCSMTIVNKKSENLIDHCGRADFLVVVTKHPMYVKPKWLKNGVCIIDIYANLIKEIPSKKAPGQSVPVIRGGVDVESVKGKAGIVFPIPGGLMSIVLAVLFRNAIQSFLNHMKRSEKHLMEHEKI